MIVRVVREIETLAELPLYDAVTVADWSAEIFPAVALK